MAEFSESRHQAEFNQSRVLEDCLAVTFALLCNCPQFSLHHHSKIHFWHRYMKPKWLSFNPTYDASSRFQNHCQLSSIWSMSDVLSCGYMALLAKVTCLRELPNPCMAIRELDPQILPVTDPMLVCMILNAFQWNAELALDLHSPKNQPCLTVTKSNGCANMWCSCSTQLPNLGECT